MLKLVFEVDSNIPGAQKHLLSRRFRGQLVEWLLATMKI